MGIYDTSTLYLYYSISTAGYYYVTARNATKLSNHLYVYKNSTWEPWKQNGTYNATASYIIDYIHDMYLVIINSITLNY
jgi:hypothetical protein